MIRLTLVAVWILLLALAKPCGVMSSPSQAPAVLVVLVFDEGCQIWCQKVRPIMNEIKAQYKTRVEFLELDTSDKARQVSETKAKLLGVSAFLHDSAEWVPVVGVFTRQHKLYKELVGPKGKQVYVSVIEKALESP